MNSRLPHAARTIAYLLALWCCFGDFSPAIAQTPSTSASSGPSKSLDQAAGVFAPDHVFQIEIEIAEADFDTLSGAHRSRFGRQGDERPAVPATVIEGTNVYRDVVVHIKGAAGSFRPITGKPALTLNFDKRVKGQTFHGLQRLSLNNSVQDPSFLTEQICREMFAAAGVPVPRATHAVVKLNHRNLGLYVLVEAYNKQFLRRTFTKDSGHLYDGGFLREITDGLDLASGDTSDDGSDLRRLFEAATNGDTSTQIARLENVLDLDRFLSFLAVDVMTCNWDGYAMNRNNYRIYHDPIKDRLVFMPHGLDQMFGVVHCDPTMGIIPPNPRGLVARAVWQNPEGRRRYLTRLNELFARQFDVYVLTNRVEALAKVVRPYLVSDQNSASSSFGNGWPITIKREGDNTFNVPPGGREFRVFGSVASFDQEVNFLKQRIAERGASLREQLGRP